MGDKIYCTARQIMLDSFGLARMVYDSGFQPTVQATLLWGGSTVGHHVHNFLKYGLGVDIRAHMPVRCQVAYESQEELDQLDGKLKVDRGTGFMALLEVVKPNDRLLIVDEVCQTTATLQSMVEGVLEQYGGGPRPEVRTAVLHFKPGEARSNYRPDYLIHETGAWVVYSWGLHRNMPDAEILRFWGPEVLDLLRK